jgi:hypothetical protein
MFALGEEQPALEPHLVVIPAHGLLLVDPHAVLVKEAALRRAPQWVLGHRAPTRSGRPPSGAPGGTMAVR